MLNGEPISYAHKKQVIVTLLLSKAEYIAFNLVAWETMWLQLIFIELRLFTPNNQFAKIYIDKNDKCIEAIISPNSIEQISDQSQVFFASQNLSSIKLKDDN